ncbi:unnamed protein product [Parascedosporium putredinis]|uniref:Cysteine-rich transmembrane CYSTM domain-containing protein n=1 Tax=Parascedosporium putredinis TaxID=1442378 RepID=A0A9P1H7I3_9PEZI|nr:unnamed protein product [Parascedosporium putredinis]CAI7998524.1 unnamed protein product [Parascedosporium putredinis]
MSAAEYYNVGPDYHRQQPQQQYQSPPPQIYAQPQYPQASHGPPPQVYYPPQQPMQIPAQPQHPPKKSSGGGVDEACECCPSRIVDMALNVGS